MAAVSLAPPTQPLHSSFAFLAQRPHSADGVLPLNKRPKLSLNTDSCKPRSLGRGNTGLRLDTLSATSPTQRNTFKNCFDAPSAGSTPISSTGRSGSLRRASSSLKPPTPHPLWQDGSAPASPSHSFVSTSSGSSPGHSPTRTTLPSSKLLRLITVERPKSILTNASNRKRRRTSEDSTTSGPDSETTNEHSVKRIRFREPIQEEIYNVRFTAKHSDLLDSASDVDEVETTQSQCDSAETIDSDAKVSSTASSVPSLVIPQAGESDAETATADSSEDDDGFYPKTPVAGRRKRTREWVWTLGPLPTQETSEKTDEGAINDTKRKDMMDGPPAILISTDVDI